MSRLEYRKLGIELKSVGLIRQTTKAILLMLAYACMTCSHPSNVHKASHEISIIESEFPLELGTIDLTDSTSSLLPGDEVKKRIENTIRDYYTNECAVDSLHNYMDTYVNTIRLKDSVNTLFIVLLKNYPTEELNAKVLFYENATKRFLDASFDFKIYALYDLENGQLKPSNLKSMFKIEGPEIERVDFNNDGVSDFKFTRLYHNGTFNSIHTTIFNTKNGSLDTLDFKDNPL